MRIVGNKTHQPVTLADLQSTSMSQTSTSTCLTANVRTIFFTKLLANHHKEHQTLIVSLSLSQEHKNEGQVKIFSGYNNYIKYIF